MEQLIFLIRSNLTRDLLNDDYGPHPLAGHCYVASEVLYHLIGRENGLFPVRARDARGICHWWLENDEGDIFDITAEQYTDVGLTPPYASGRAGGFLTKEPSKRARKLMERL